jgi:predicted nucleotidyltransferase
MTEITSLIPGEPLFLAPRHYAELLRILRTFVPSQDVWAFGSRATGLHLGRFSDLDLAIEHRLPSGVRGDLIETLDESDLPINVDLIELDSVDTAFAERIRPDFVLVLAGNLVNAS